MATQQAVLARRLHAVAELDLAKRTARPDAFLLAGFAIAAAAILLSLHAAGVSVAYFLQPSAAAMVLGGTAGVMLVTTPRYALMQSLLRVREVISTSEVDRAALIEEIVDFARRARRAGAASMEALISNVRNPRLHHAVELMADISNREELRSVLETELEMAERQGDADAKTLEVAGGFAPTLGIIGTVIGLIDVLRQFGNLSSAGYGMGTAFVSTIYGLGLANLLLLPAAQRIRARVAENCETQQLIMEGVLGIAATTHPSVIRVRLNSFLRESPAKRNAS